MRLWLLSGCRGRSLRTRAGAVMAEADCVFKGFGDGHCCAVWYNGGLLSCLAIVHQAHEVDEALAARRGQGRNGLLSAI